ncbi:DUF262 domain-containing protein [Corynebacterium sp. UBA2622]|uniref:DUF262 domain-containing protein n=1 Tax=Corynebacterium sp. UBA2622 TaxID=1946393 RepID=UPI0025C24A52|nr:DUF262 domain-containing protein [Corynebacterium sp. UBA2622]
MGFTTPSYSLSDLFARADRGELQLPDFQREYIWDVDRIRTLVTSVLRGYPIGSLLALDTRNVPMRFRARAIEGAPDTGRDPGLLLLDGQQRLTSLYHAFRGDGEIPTVDFLGRPIRRRFYVDVAAAVSADPMPVEAVFAVDPDGRVCSHFGPGIEGGIHSRRDMLAHGVVPVSALLWPEGDDLLFDMAAEGADEGRREAAKLFHSRVVSHLPAYTVPVIRIDRETPLTGIGQIFAHANSAGVQMDVFELLTSLFALEDPGFVLAEHWAGVERRLRAHPVLERVGRTEYLRAMSLVVTSRRGPALGHRGDILNLSLSDYLAHAGELTAAFEAAAHFLAQRRIFTAEQVPYAAQIVSLAAILARLSADKDALDQRGIDRLNQWFWCGVLGELYGAHAPTIRSGSDVDEVTPWAAGETDRIPRTVADASFSQSRLLTAGPESGVYRGLYALIMGRGARDWRTGLAFDAAAFRDLDPRFNQVFPRGYCDSRGVDAQLAGSVLNRTPMGIRTQVLMEDNGPKRYLPRLQSKSLLEDEEFDAMLAGHLLDPTLLLASDHDAFFRDRLRRLTGAVEYSIGKPVDRDLENGGDTMGE